MMDTRDPMDRLSSAYRIEVDPETRERHVAEMGVALRNAPPTPIPTGFGLRRRVAAVAAAVVVLAPAGMALAAEDAVPGDFLYPVKEVTERVRSFVDQGVRATHRVEEVERLMFLRAPGHAVARAVERAESATAQLPESGELRLRLELARAQLQMQDEQRRLTDGDGSGEGGQESGSDSEKAGPGGGTGSTGSPGTGGSSSQDQDGSGTTGTTLGQGQAEQGSGEPSTTEPQGSEGSNQP